MSKCLDRFKGGTQRGPFPVFRLTLEFRLLQKINGFPISVLQKEVIFAFRHPGDPLFKVYWLKTVFIIYSCTFLRLCTNRPFGVYRTMTQVYFGFYPAFFLLFFDGTQCLNRRSPKF